MVHRRVYPEVHSPHVLANLVVQAEPQRQAVTDADDLLSLVAMTPAKAMQPDDRLDVRLNPEVIRNSAKQYEDAGPLNEPQELLDLVVVLDLNPWGRRVAALEVVQPDRILDNRHVGYGVTGRW